MAREQRRDIAPDASLDATPLGSGDATRPAGPQLSPGTGAPAPSRASAEPDGYIDRYGHFSVGGGWLLCGWIAERWPAGREPAATLGFDMGEIAENATGAFFYRGDLGTRGVGVVMFVPGSGLPAGKLLSVTVDLDGRLLTLKPTSAIAQLVEREVIAEAKAALANAHADKGRAALLALLTQRTFTGANTLASLNEPIRIDFDEAILCPPQGLILAGWLAAPAGCVKALRVRSGHLVTPVNLGEAIRVERGDVVEAVGQEVGFSDLKCGFVAYLPRAVVHGESLYLEVETARGAIGFIAVPRPKLRGIAAIKRLLGLFEVRYAELGPAFDHVAGPAVAILNRERLAERPAVSVIEFGPVPVNPHPAASVPVASVPVASVPVASVPVASVIVPLYGRIDFMEYQLAFFAGHAGSAGHDLIYVLDDPGKEWAAQHLAESAYERFRVPFRLAILSRNVGYAPANNIGLSLARGRQVCFLNSDVFPGTPDWLERLAARLDANPELGAVGPLLLYEDGSVQHEGITFEAVPRFGRWMFPQHSRKGWRPSDHAGLGHCEAITGACLMMRTDLAREMGGFDESFVIGDFEDTDLCLRLRERGLGCAVDHDVRLYHLERRSQAEPSQRWRMNLTLYNAWVHQRRWFGGASPGTGPAVPSRPSEERPLHGHESRAECS